MEYRGFMLDVCRHYMPVSDILRLLDAAEVIGLNIMHWHLTDDQAWRLEIHRYPRLTETGSIRGPSCFGAVSATENNNGFYTQEEARQIVRYAAEKGITVIPEIEMPGHASAALAAYPELMCRRTVCTRDGETAEENAWPARVETTPGIFPNLLCAGKEETYVFLKEVLSEVLELFPSPWIHIGGDEALKLHWRRCPDCQARMKLKGIRSEDALQRDLVLEIGAWLAEQGRKTIVWNDVLEGGILPPHFVVQQWLGEGTHTRAFLEQGGQVIVSDTSAYYLDYCYGQIDVWKMWRYPRVPQYAEGYEQNILGIECPLWTERITNTTRAAWQLFPRLVAAAIRAGEPEDPDWPDFLARVREGMRRVEALTGLPGAPERLWALTEAQAAEDREQERRRIESPAMQPLLRKEHMLLSLDRAERLMEQIGMPRAFALRGGDAILEEIEGRPAPEEDGATEMVRHIMLACDNRLWGPWKEIPEKIWLDTMRVFTRFVGEHRRSYGRDGFDRGFWTTRQRDAKLFRLGELEFELAEENGERWIGLHIPSDARLEPERLNASVRTCRSFLAEYFPDWKDLPIRCESWLLSPTLEMLLPPESRILRFRKAFDITETFPENQDALEWVFHVARGQRKDLNLLALPEKTSLQRKMKKLLLSGGRLGAAAGILARSF